MSEEDWKKGVIAVFKRNKKRRFFLASQENEFGGIRVSNVMIDSGCNSILLPLEPDQLATLLELFPRSKNYAWRIGISNGVSGTAPVLVIAALAPSNKIPVKLAKDLIPDASPIKLSRLRFHLCSEDVKVFVKSDALMCRLEAQDYRKVLLDFEASSSNVRRRTHALVGQGFIRGASVIQHDNVALIVNPEEYFAPFWAPIGEIDGVLQRKARLPERFDVLEDDDHDANDDDDEEDFHMEFDDIDCIDE